MEAQAVAAAERVGRTLRGKWRLDALLGVGGMASVYAATHRNGKRGAVKILHGALGDEARKRFLREGYASNRVGHPGVPSVLDDDIDEDGAIFLVMELLEGSSLEEVRMAAPSGRLPVGEVLDIASATLDVLAAAHDRGVLHRDLKPANLFRTTRGEIKLLDFGIARILEATTPSAGTKDGFPMGSLGFMPPEQAHGEWKDVDARSDLWAVGATMFTLLSGRFVTEGETIPKMLLTAMTRPAPLLSSVLTGVPAGVAAIVDRALRFDRQERWANARAMKDAVDGARRSLGGAASGEPPFEPTPLAVVAPPRRRASGRNRWPLGIALAAAATLSAVVVVLTSGEDTAPPPGAAAPPTETAAAVAPATATAALEVPTTASASSSASAAPTASEVDEAAADAGAARPRGGSGAKPPPRASALPRDPFDGGRF
jgi:serine/threonine-protein kinase